MNGDFDRLVRAELSTLTDLLLSGSLRPDRLHNRQWRGLVEVFTAQLTEHAKRPGAAGWSRLSSAYDHLLDIANRSGDLSADECTVRRLNLTSALLRTVPPDDDIRLLSPLGTARSFLSLTPLSATEAGRLAAYWTDLDRTEIGRLRAIKNLLRPVLQIKHLLDDGEERVLLDQWQKVLPFLP